MSLSADKKRRRNGALAILCKFKDYASCSSPFLRIDFTSSKDLIAACIEVFRSKPLVIGEHVWNMCDFKISQGITRMGGYNYKDVFTFDRGPKMAAHKLKEIWQSKKESA